MGLWPADDARWRMLDRAFLLLTGALFGWNLLVWRGLAGDGTAWRPLSSVLLTGAMFVQAGASLVRRRSLPLFYLALVASVGLMVASTLVAR